MGNVQMQTRAISPKDQPKLKTRVQEVTVLLSLGAFWSVLESVSRLSLLWGSL
jgi:hypothetical protein